jgi:serine/threonine-protein kinase RsbW
MTPREGSAQSPFLRASVTVAKAGVTLRAPATNEALPVIRQTLRAVGSAVGADAEPLEDAELAVDEAAAQAIGRAGRAPGCLEVEIRPQARELVVVVREPPRRLRMLRGRRGRRDARLAAAIIEGLAQDVEVRRPTHRPPELVMSFAISDEPLALGRGSGAEAVERIASRLVAVVAAEADMPMDRVVEAVLVAELAARNTPSRLVGDVVSLTLDVSPGGLELRIGPLEPGGADDLVVDSELPGVGPVLARLADAVAPAPTNFDDAPGAEDVVIRLSLNGTHQSPYWPR